MRRGESVESNVDMVDSPRGRSLSLWTQLFTQAQNHQVWSSQCWSLRLEPEACPVQEGRVYGRRNGDRPVEHLAEQGERREQLESGEQRLDPLAGASEDQKCQGRVRVWLL